MKNNSQEVEKLYATVGILNRSAKKEIRNTLNVGTIYRTSKTGVATASSSTVQKNRA